jgi:hypothetical protein
MKVQILPGSNKTSAIGFREKPETETYMVSLPGNLLAFGFVPPG